MTVQTLQLEWSEEQISLSPRSSILSCDPYGYTIAMWNNYDGPKPKGRGWRLPTVPELQSAFLSKVPGFDPEHYLVDQTFDIHWLKTADMRTGKEDSVNTEIKTEYVPDPVFRLTQRRAYSHRELSHKIKVRLVRIVQ